MAQCWLCGRATVDYSSLPFNICVRAGCLPELRELEARLNAERIDHWAITRGFERRAADDGNGGGR